MKLSFMGVTAEVDGSSWIRALIHRKSSAQRRTYDERLIIFSETKQKLHELLSGLQLPVSESRNCWMCHYELTIEQRFTRLDERYRFCLYWDNHLLQNSLSKPEVIARHSVPFTHLMHKALVQNGVMQDTQIADALLKIFSVDIKIPGVATAALEPNFVGRGIEYLTPKEFIGSGIHKVTISWDMPYAKKSKDNGTQWLHLEYGKVDKCRLQVSAPPDYRMVFRGMNLPPSMDSKLGANQTSNRADFNRDQKPIIANFYEQGEASSNG